ncbi:phosphatase PAP2 family protein [Streptomyces sp. HSW2009]|uniref:phosphatase PAP2 family protein n=1 Tax=Streptomyces sp. HSW2009 TaxID=3142890 RepID=UPI0032EDF05E
MLFSLLTWQVAADGGVRALDERLGRSVARPGALPSERTPSAFVSRIAELCADLGGVAAVVPVVLVAVVYASRCGPRVRLRLWWLPPLSAALARAAVPAVVAPLKAWLGRPGPAGAPLADGSGYFPSGHAATAAVGYGAALVLTVFAHTALRLSPPPEAPSAPAVLAVSSAAPATPVASAKTAGRGPGRWVWRWATAAMVVLNLAVGLGLVRRGYHWPADVLASWCLSVVLVRGVVWSAHRALARQVPPSDGAPSPAAASCMAHSNTTGSTRAPDPSGGLSHRTPPVDRPG